MDSRFTPVHISLYHALFQIWNMNHFESSFVINRSVVLKFCKIGSNHTYYKALNDLHNWGYIKYTPSFSPSKGAIIYLCNLEPDQPPNNQIPEEPLSEIDTAIGAEMHQDLCRISIGENQKTQINGCKYDIGSGANMHHNGGKIDIARGANMHPYINI